MMPLLVDNVIPLDLLWLGELLVQAEFDRLDSTATDHGLMAVVDFLLESLECGMVVVVGFDDAYEGCKDS